MEVQVCSPLSEEDWQGYYELRWRILRAPWQEGGCERDQTDDISIHRMVRGADGRVLAVGRLHRRDDGAGQIRYMAVEQGFERRGLGTRILRALEAAAADERMDTIVLNAREGAVPFYLHHGYEVVEASFLLFGEIQHYLMKKPLREPVPETRREVSTDG